MSLIILGIDPGTLKAGYGVILLEGTQVKCLDYGSISTPKNIKISKRVYLIHQEIQHLYQKYQPHHTAVEKMFIGKNPDAAFKLGYIFALCLLESERHNSEFFEYPSRLVKKNVTFSGKASKKLVQTFVSNVLTLKSVKSLDATDALAVALCHIQQCQSLKVREQLGKMAL